MNHTPRGLNRFLLGFIGIILLAVGLLAILIPLSADLGRGVSSALANAHDWATRLWASAPLGDTGHSWYNVALVALFLVLIIIGIWMIVRQGRGRTGMLLTRTGSDAGSASRGGVTLSTDLFQTLLRDALDSDPDVLAVSVSGYDHRKYTGVKISLSARRGASPDRLAKLLEHLIARWDELLGEELPVMIEITGGFRSQTSRPRRAA